MSLNADYSKIEKWETLCCEKKQPDGSSEIKPLTQAITMLTMAIGMNRITVENAFEVYARISMLEMIIGSNLSELDILNKRQPRYITLEDVVAHIGLWTNSSSKSATQFAKDIYTIHREKTQRDNREVYQQLQQRISEEAAGRRSAKASKAGKASHYSRVG